MYDPAEVLVRLEEHGATAAQYFAVQDCGLSKGLCQTPQVHVLPDPAEFYSQLLIHTLEWSRFHAENNSAAGVKPLQLRLGGNGSAAGSEGTRLVDMSRAVISSAMTMYLGKRPNYGDVSIQTTSHNLLLVSGVGF